jgi:hypothetical protein
MHGTSPAASGETAVARPASSLTATCDRMSQMQDTEPSEVEHVRETRGAAVVSTRAGRSAQGEPRHHSVEGALRSNGCLTHHALQSRRTAFGGGKLFWREDSRHPWRSPFGPSDEADVRSGILPLAVVPALRVRLPPPQAKKQKGPPFGDPFCFFWWRWRESNPRPKVLHPQLYMLSSPFDLVRRQHDVRGASTDQRVGLTVDRCAASQWRSRDNDPTSTSTGTSGFGAYALSGESVVVVVGN